MTLVLDAGALIAVERADRHVAALLAREHRAGRVPITHGGVVGQVWRVGARQARLARALRGVGIAPVDSALGRNAGALLGFAASEDVIDAAVVLLAQDGDELLTSDPQDISALAEASGIDLDVVPV